MPGMFNQSLVNQVQQANDIVDVVSEHVSLKKKGREMVGLCPFHDDHRPSFYVNPSKQIFKCFACGAGGGVFTFVQMRENLTFPQAVQRLAERVGIKIESARIKNRQAGRQPDDVDPNRLAKVNAWAAEYFENNLYDDRKGKYARDYIASREISLQNAKTWRLGLAIDSCNDLIRAATTKKIPMKLLEQAGLVTAQNQDKFVNRLIFPITDVTGRVIGFGGRTLSDQGAKYINSPTTALFDKSNSLYGLEQARHKIVSIGTAIVVEGYTDCIMAHQFGCTNVVASLGTSFTAGHGRILRRYAKEIVLVFDSDVAGIEAANRALEVCLSQCIDIRIASMPEGKDPCDFILVAGKKGFEQLVNEAVDVLEFKWTRLKEKFSGEKTLAGRKSAIEEYLQSIASARAAGSLQAIDRGLIVNKLSGILGLDSRQINTELNRRFKRAVRTSSYKAAGSEAVEINWGEGLSAAAEREVLEVLVSDPRSFDIVRGKVDTEKFKVPILRQVAAILFELLENDVNISLAQILARAESVQVSNCIAELARIGQEKGNFRARLTDALHVLRRYQTQREKKQAKTVEDESILLQQVYDQQDRENRHSLGMV
jgi:DNA primase